MDLGASTILLSHKRPSVVFTLIRCFLVSNASYGAEWLFADVLSLEIERQECLNFAQDPSILFFCNKYYAKCDTHPHTTSLHRQERTQFSDNNSTVQTHQ